MEDGILPMEQAIETVWAILKTGIQSPTRDFILTEIFHFNFTFLFF